MSGSSYNEVTPVSAGADLRTHQWKVINVSGTLCAVAATGLGVLQNKPASGDDASLAFFGRSKFAAGGAVTAGKCLTVASGGWLVAASSGNVTVGRSLEAVASGFIGRGIFDFTTFGFLPLSLSG